MKTGIELITEERTKQIEVYGWTSEHDAHHAVGELANAAANHAMTYCAAEVVKTYLPIPSWPMLWPFESMKPKAANPEDRIKELTKAGAFIAAEIDRLLRLQESSK